MAIVFYQIEKFSPGFRTGNPISVHFPRRKLEKCYRTFSILEKASHYKNCICTWLIFSIFSRYFFDASTQFAVAL